MSETAAPPASASNAEATHASSSTASSNDSLSVLETAWTRLSDGVAALQHSGQLAQRRLELEFATIDGCVKSHELLLKECRKMAQLLEEVEREQGGQGDSAEATRALLSDYRLKLGLLRTSLDRLRDTKPRIDLGWFMRLMVGRVPMTLWKHGDRIRFKDEYNKFKARTTLIFIMWPLVQLLLHVCAPEPGAQWRGSVPGLCFGFSLSTHSSELLLQAHQLWLLYYYTTLSLRENILLANGSDILHWWIYHHYISMFLSALMLLWPSAYMLHARRLELLVFGLLQGLIMLFQNNYQKRRLYVRKTLGKAKAIDVESSETLVEKPTDLQALIPMLFVLYAIELWFGAPALLYCWQAGTAFWSSSGAATVPLMALAFLVLAVGNAWTTGRVLVSKSRSRQLKQMVKQRISGLVGGVPGGRNNVTKKQE